jgi:hypothetical protein
MPTTWGRGAAAAALLLGGAALAGCERVVTLEVPEGPVRLVVEARLERVRGRVSGAQSIRLTTTAPYFAAAAPPPARNAVVRVTDETGAAVTFAESAARPGFYTTDALTLTTGRRYTLAIDYAGQRYEATEVAQPVAAIDALYFAPPAGVRAGAEAGLRATVDLRDPRGVRNWYLWDQFVDGARLLGPDSTTRLRVVATDEGFDGLRVVGYQPYDGARVAPGSTVLVRQVALSESAYRYYFALGDQTFNDGTPFDVPLASVRGNVVNRTDPSRPALGYFIAAEVAEARAVVPR